MTQNLEVIDHSVLFSLLKGEPGTTKSSQALTWPKPQYWISWDGKMQALARAMKHFGINGKDISFDNYDDWDGPRNILEKFQMSCDYRTIVIDSITSGSDYILRALRRGKTGTRSSGKAAGKEVGGIAVNELEDFNGESSALGELMALTKYLFEHKQINIVLIAHVVRTEQKSADMKSVSITRQIVTAGKKIAAKIPAYCTEVFQFESKGSLTGGAPAIKIHTVGNGDDFARTSLPIPNVIDLNYDNLYEKWVLPGINALK